MTKNDFLKQLEELLKALPEHDRQDAIAYYEDYFEEAGVEKEAAIIRELGSPAKVAETIKNAARGNEQAQYTEKGYSEEGPSANQNTPMIPKEKKEKQKRQISWPLIIVILIFTLPLWGGLLSGVFGLLVSVVATVFAILLAMFALVLAGVIGGAVSIGVGIVGLFTEPAFGFLMLGLGAIFFAIGLLLLVVLVWLLGAAIPAIFRFIVDGVQKLWDRMKGGRKNE